MPEIADTYTTQTTIEAWLQLGVLSGTTRPTAVEAINMAAGRAGQIRARMAGVVGNSAPGPPSYSVSIDSSTDAGRALADALRELNATGAAIDALQAAGAVSGPNSSERMDLLTGIWSRGMGGSGDLDPIADLVRAYVGLGARASTHISSGESAEENFTSTEQGLEVRLDNVEF